MSDTNRFDRQLGGISALSRMKRPEGAPVASPSMVTIPTPALSPELPATAVPAIEAQPAPTSEPRGSVATETPPTAPQRPVERRSTPRTPSRPSGGTKTPQKAVQRSLEPDSPKEQIGPRVSRDVTQRARAAYRATGYLEGEASFSDFVENAILREVERREKTANAGKPFPTSGRLPTGRPLKT